MQLLIALQSSSIQHRALPWWAEVQWCWRLRWQQCSWKIVLSSVSPISLSACLCPCCSTLLNLGLSWCSHTFLWCCLWLLRSECCHCAVASIHWHIFCLLHFTPGSSWAPGRISCLYSAGAACFVLITGVISMDLASNQSLFSEVFLPKVAKVVFWIVSLTSLIILENFSTFSGCCILVVLMWDFLFCLVQWSFLS